MPEVRFGFETPEGLSGELAYAREPGDGGRLELRFTSPRLRRADGSDKWFELRFNNIGETGPLAFLESLDQGYLNDKLTNLSVRRFDLFGTVENVRRVLEEEGRELEPDQVEAAERAIDLAAEAFAGDHRSACEGLIRALQRTDLPCFRDDPFHLIGSRGTLESRLFERIVWPALLLAVEDRIGRDPELEGTIEAVVAGVSLPTPEPDEGGWSEPDPGF